MTDLAAKYRLQRALSWTSAARTFAGEDPESKERLAVKVVSLAGEPQRDALTRRFTSTASVLQALAHPTLPEIVDYGVTDAGEAFFASTWFPGAPLSELALPPGDLLVVVMQVVEALESLSLHGLVHLGISPENVLVMPDHKAQLTGWGSSLLTVDWQSGQRAVLGVSNAYSAPELGRGGGIADALWRADLFSVAAMTAELLGAEVDTTTEGAQVRFSGGLSKEIERPESLRSALESCLHPDPDHRPDAYSIFSKALQHAMPRQRRQDPTATQPMPRLRSLGPSKPEGAAQSDDLLEGTVLVPPPLGAITPPAAAKAAKRADVSVKDVEDTESAATSSSRPASQAKVAGEGARIKKSKPAVSSKVKRARKDNTGVHAIRQETGSFVLPKSSSEQPIGSGPMFEADELGRMIDDLAGEELLDPATDSAEEQEGRADSTPAEPKLGPEDRTVVMSRPVRESTTAEIKLPPKRQLNKSALVTPPAASAEHEDVAPEPVLVTRRRTPSGPRQPLNPNPSAASESTSDAIETATAHNERGAVEVDAKDTGAAGSGAATRWVSPTALNELVAKAAEEQAGSVDPEAVKEEFRGEPGEQTPDVKSAKLVPPAGADTQPPVAASAAVPEPAPATPETQAPAQSPPPVAVLAAKPGASRSKLWLGMAAVALIMVVLAGTLVAGLLRRDAIEESSSPVMPEVVVPSAPAPEVEDSLRQLPEELERLVILVAEGNWPEAVRLANVLEQRAQKGELSIADGDTLLNARQALDNGYGAELLARLGPALDKLDVNEMRDTLRGGSAAMAVLRKQPGGRDLTTRARSVLRSVDAFRSALDRGEETEPLDRALELNQAYPVLADRLEVLKRATNRVEQVAMELAEAGRLGETSALLSDIASKVELSPRMVTLSQQVSERMQARTESAELLRSAEAFGQDGVPHRGLELLASAELNPNVRVRAAEIRLGLQRQLADLDREPPTIDLMGEGIDLKRGEPLLIDLVVVDDYEVRSLRFEVIADGRPAQRLPVRAESDRNYRVQVPASLHQGKPLQFWVVAEDRSGHQGSLGSSEEPIEVRRKRWFQVFKRRGTDEG